MAVNKRLVSLYETEAGQMIEEELKSMATDIRYNTAASYSANSAYPNNLIPFVTKHMHYLNTHPKLDPDQYIANLRLMTKIR